MKAKEGRNRAVISTVKPEIEGGRFAIKRIAGDILTVTAAIFTDGYSLADADLLFRKNDQKRWRAVPMKSLNLNDRWTGHFKVDQTGLYFYTIHAWANDFKTWQQELDNKFKLGVDLSVELEIGLNMIEQALSRRPQKHLKRFLNEIKKESVKERQIELAIDQQLSDLMRDRYPNKRFVTKLPKTLSVVVDPPKALFSAWYEFFPRSIGSQPGKHGTFKDCLSLLPRVAKMGFDVLYLPPIHPIGYSKRKGKGNRPAAQPEDPGSPWAIGSYEGGHKALHPNLGSLEDFETFVYEAKRLGIDIAMDIALQCSPDHPYLKEHPNWFRWRPDGTIQYAENPPKKYEDIVPFYFETEEWPLLWEELKSVFVYWIEKGIRVFRVDNPHAKPFNFWEWLIGALKRDYPDLIFLAEAFTRPTVMYQLAKLGFTQSYTYFTWRHTKQELTNYLKEIALTEINECFRPNFWTNTPDILTEELQNGGRPAFFTRLILAATLCSNYGLYGPAFELLENHAIPGTEEYLDSEKYQLKQWNKETDKSLEAMIARLNHIRKIHPALQQTSNLTFLDIDNDQILYYGKWTLDPFDALLILVNLDPFHSQKGTFVVPLKQLNLPLKGSYKIHELLSDRHYRWEGKIQRIQLDVNAPSCLFRIQGDNNKRD